MQQNCFIAEDNFGKDCLGGYQMPLTAGLYCILYV